METAFLPFLDACAFAFFAASACARMVSRRWRDGRLETQPTRLAGLALRVIDVELLLERLQVRQP